MNFSNLILYFTIYSFLGWLVETIYCSLIEKKFVYRGFLSGPFCPIYGFGALLVIYFLGGLQFNPPLLFLSSMLVASLVEYISSYILERIFDLKWWDYSNRLGNINGRVCLWNSTLFGLLSLFLIRWANPLVVDSIARLHRPFLLISSRIFALYFIGDTIFTSKGLLDLSSNLRRIEDKVEKDFRKLQESLELGFTTRRMLRSYPRVRSQKYRRALRRIKSKLRSINK